MGASDVSILPQRTVIIPTTVFQAGAATDVPLVLQGAALQSGNLTEWRDSNNNITARVNSGGAFRVGTGATDNGWLNILTTTSAQGIVIRASSPQTANLQEWQKNDGTILAHVTSNGEIYSGWALNVGGTTTRPVASYVTYLTTVTPTNQPLVVRGATSQSANLQEWQNNSGTILSYIRYDGLIFGPNGSYFGNTNGGGYGAYIGGNATTSTALYINSSASSTAPTLVARAGASQSANIQEWQNNSGTILSWVDPNGAYNGPSASVSNFYVTPDFNTQTNGRMRLRPGTTGEIGINIAGQPSQTANLLHFQNSAGTNIAYVSASGAIGYTGSFTNISDISVKENIIDVDKNDALCSIKSLRTVKFDFINGEKNQTGFIAQEVRDALPAAVRNFDDTRLGLDNNTIVAHLVAAVQAQQEQIEELITRLNSGNAV